MKNYMRYFKTIPAVMAIALALPAMAVTEKEMEEARAITAKAYLRYANDGSGYLDDVQAKSMSELTGKLKEKEKENLKAFNKVKVPSDYASWDKARLVEFWGVTFFTSPELSEKGKAARSRVKKQINSMNISAPAPEAPAPSPAAESETLPAATAAADTAPLPTAETVVAEEQDILADQKAIMEDADESAATPREESHTWVYVLVLAILIAVVIWLVVFAAKLMKKQPDGTPESMAADNEELREKARKAIARKNEELEAMRVRMEEAERNESELSRKAEALKAENRQLLEQAEALRLENSRLKGEALAAQTAQTTRPAAQPQAPQPQPHRETAPVLKVLYLGRVNSRGIFVRADRRVSPGNTIYRLDTNDGLVGTFRVVDVPEVVDTALANPEQYLRGGCNAEDFTEAAGAENIITENAGTAIFENGYWKVLRKSDIRFE